MFYTFFKYIFYILLSSTWVFNTLPKMCWLEDIFLIWLNRHFFNPYLLIDHPLSLRLKYQPWRISLCRAKDLVYPFLSNLRKDYFYFPVFLQWFELRILKLLPPNFQLSNACPLTLCLLCPTKTKFCFLLILITII